jgi:hypothetical protein
MKKELIIFFIIFILFSLFIHLHEFLNFPLEHIKNLPRSSAYGLGFLHPFIISLIIYTLLWIPRSIIRIFHRKYK